jgi:hypothetical protein
LKFLKINNLIYIYLKKYNNKVTMSDKKKNDTVEDDNNDNNDNNDNKDFSNTLAFRIADLENYYADSVLSDELKEIYAQVQLNCNDFRNNVFFKNLDIMEVNLVFNKIIYMFITHLLFIREG